MASPASNSETLRYGLPITLFVLGLSHNVKDARPHPGDVIVGTWLLISRMYLNMWLRPKTNYIMGKAQLGF